MKVASKAAGKVRERPAETTGLAGAATLLVAHLLGVTDPTTLVAIGVVVASLPAGVTWLVNLVRGSSNSATPEG